MEMQGRTLSFRDNEESGDHADKVRDYVVEAGNDTRNTNQYVKFVNASIQDKTSKLQKIKEAQKRFEQEVDMFKTAFDQPKEQTDVTGTDVETAQIVRELSLIINRYGMEKITKALNQVFSNK
jgi:DNA-binding ferritin-like protein (Dps family)